MGQELRQARYVGRKKKRLQALSAAAVNFKRFFNLAKGDTALIGEALKRLSAGRPTFGWSEVVIRLRREKDRERVMNSITR